MTASDGVLGTVSGHYTIDDLSNRILADLEADGKDVHALQLEDLAHIDQLHAGGMKATRVLMDRGRLEPGMSLLDVGGGLGGPARLIARNAGCQVSVLDLTETLCETGEVLTERTGLTDQVTFIHGNALDMPFPDAAFDRVWTQHSTMNIEDKERLYGEIHRVLRPAGLLVMQEILAGPVQPAHYPVPWAEDASISFLRSEGETQALLTATGFCQIEWVDERAAMSAAPQPAGGPVGVGPREGTALAMQLKFGPRMIDMAQNVRRNLQEDRLAVIQAVFERV